MKAVAVDLPIERFELGCGATLIVSRRPGAPVAAVRAHMRGGPALEPEGKEGLSSLVGRFVDQGTEDHSEAELAALLEPAGGEIAGDANGVGGTIVSPQWRLLLDCLCEVLTRPVYPDDEIELQTRRLLHRLKIEQEDPRTQGHRRFRRLVYGRHWLGRPFDGYLESVAKTKAAHLRRYHAQHWVGRRCIFGVCGDVDPARVRAHLERRLADWNPGTALAPRQSELPAPGVRVDAFPADRQQVHVFLGHIGIRREDPDYPALVVMDYILGTGPGFTNRISRRLRDELGLAYAVGADIHSSAGLLPGTFKAYIGTSPEHLATAVAGILHEVRLLQREVPSKKELETAVQYLVGSFALGFERAARRAAYLVSAELHGFPEDNLQRLPLEFQGVSAADVRRVARRHLFPDRCCLAASGPTSRKELAAILAQA